jgi:hypothetical protein
VFILFGLVELHRQQLEFGLQLLALEGILVGDGIVEFVLNCSDVCLELFGLIPDCDQLLSQFSNVGVIAVGQNLAEDILNVDAVLVVTDLHYALVDVLIHQIRYVLDLLPVVSSLLFQLLYYFVVFVDHLR